MHRGGAGSEAFLTVTVGEALRKQGREILNLLLEPQESEVAGKREGGGAREEFQRNE